MQTKETKVTVTAKERLPLREVVHLIPLKVAAKTRNRLRLRQVNELQQGII